MEKDVRTPVVAGMFYEQEPEDLKKQIEKCFLDTKFGPGRLPGERSNRKIIGIIAPHAGYQFSGAGQALCYKEIAESEFPDVYIIIGTSHMGCENAAVTTDDFKTPFGIIKNDKEFSNKLAEKNAVIIDKYPHIREHSVEVQLPFLDFVNKEKELKIVPVVADHDCDYKNLGKAIAETAKELNKKIVIIASSDFTHYGISYGYMPFKENIKENMEELDREAIEWIKKLDAKSFLDYVDDKQATICGARAIAAVIVACKELEAKKVNVLQYYTSGDVTEDYSNSVGYASIVII